MKKTNKLLCLLLVLLMCVGIVACSNNGGGTENGSTVKKDDKTITSQRGNQTEKEEEKSAELNGTVKVGVICSLSSTHAATNGWLMGSLQATADIVNKNGGLDGKQLVFELYDPESDAGTVKQRLTDIKNSGAICAIYGAGDPYSPAAAQWALENEFPVFLTCNISTEVTIGNYSDYAFNVGKNAWGFGKILALYCVGEQGYKNFCFVGTDGAATIDAENFLIYEGKKINPEFEMLASYRINFNDTEFSNIISAVSALHPQMVLQQGGGPNFVSFCQQASLFDLFSSCDVYNDLVTDASTNQPLIEGNEFPYGKTHGVFYMPFWDSEILSGEFGEYVEAYNNSDVAKEKGYYPGDATTVQYLIMKCMVLAVKDCVDNGKDYTDPKVLAKAISNVEWEDTLGKHYFRKGLDNQLTSNLYYGTSAQSDDFPGVAICTEYKVFTPDEYLPTVEEMKAWGESHNFDVSRFN